MFFYSQFATFKKIKNEVMNFWAGFEFILFLILFGLINFLIVLKRYEYDLRKQKLTRRTKISKLYPSGTFISL